MLRIGILSSAAFVSVAATAAADEPIPGAKPAESKSMLSRLNPFGSDSGKSAPAPNRPRPMVGPLAPDAMIQALQAEQDAYARRLDICTELRRVAAGTKDDKLAVQADELERLAEQTYNQRIAKLGVKSQHRSNPAFDKLDSELGTGVATNPLQSGGVRTPGDVRPATAQARNFREVKQ